MDRDDLSIDHLARLARLELEPGEAEQLRDQLARILTHVETLQSLPAEGGDAGLPALRGRLREDEPAPGLPTGDALANAPAQTRGQFVVPPILDTE